jgi:hypothetical protein
VKQFHSMTAMHCILEGLAHIHFREFLGLTTVSASTPLPLVKAFTHNFQPAIQGQSDMTPKEIKQVAEIHQLLTAAVDDEYNWEDLKTKLCRKNQKSLIFICNDLQIRPSRVPQRCYKSDWAERLVTWVSL